MEYKILKNGFKIPSLGLDTWMIGGDGRKADYSHDKEEITMIKKAIKLGYTLIDTAEVYGTGHCEELVGKAIKNFKRSNIFLTTKVAKTHLKYKDVISAARSSLKRLQTNYLDLYLIHAPNEDVPLAETMKAMNYLADQKIIKHIGVSNFKAEEMIEAQKYSDYPIAVNQIEYNLLIRNQSHYVDNKDMERKTIPYCQAHDIIVMAERPLERGLLLEAHPLLNQLAKKYQKTQAQIAINWLITKKNIVTIPKSTNFDHLKENLDALGWRLDDKDEKELDRADFSQLAV